jgi:Putative transposase/Transposase zinc-binding domain
VSEHRLEVADVIHQHGEEFLKRWGRTVSPQQRKALRDIGACRTAILGGHIEQCNHCSHRVNAYNSCRNRHCPKCQSSARDRWLSERAKELLPVPYSHVVFTVPEGLASLALQNQRVFYGLLFRAVSETLLEVAADPRHLGAQIGFLAVLHTWSQNLLYHPHVHCVVAAGGIAPGGSRWIPCRRKFFLPVRVLSRLFRGKLLDFLGKAFSKGTLRFSGQLTAFADPARFQPWLRTFKKSDWVVYAKPPFGGPTHVLKYLARYTHRVAISNGRLLRLEQGRISFRWRDSRDNNRTKVMTLEAVAFIRRFLLHILPVGFVKIRHFGFLANRNRAVRLDLCRKLLNAQTPAESPPELLTEQQERAAERRCPECKIGTLRFVEGIPSNGLLILSKTTPSASPIDSS